MKKLNIPVAMFGFNRPEKLAIAISSLKLLAPDDVWFFIDGPRIDKPQEKILCDEVESLVALFDWGCKVVVRRNTVNKGLRAQIRDGLTEFFGAWDVGLIMEDDICFSTSAIDYINHVVKFIDGKEIAAASLNNFLIPGKSVLSTAIREGASPYLSRLFHCWGWVTTRDGWKIYQDDIENECNADFFRNVEKQFSGFRSITTQWNPIVAMLCGGLQSWACRYQLSIWKAGAKCIVPPINLATNIGFGLDATHTRSAPSWLPDWILEDGVINFGLPFADNIDCDIEELSITENAPEQIQCRLCGHIAQKVFVSAILNTPRLYYECIGCECLQTSFPTWLKTAYNNNISIFDTGVMIRNLSNFVVTKNIASLLSGQKKLSVLEYGAGSGMLTRMLRDSGVETIAYDVNNIPSLAGAYVTNSLSEFEERATGSRSLILAFEVFEHFSEPSLSIAELFSANPHAVLITTDIYQGQDANWPYLIPFSGQHVFFYSITGLSLIAEKYGYDLISEGSAHLFLSKRMVDSETRSNKLALQTALKNSIYGDGGLNRFISHLGSVSGVMQDYNALIAEKYQSPNYLQPRIYLNQPESGLLYIDCVFFQMASTGIAKLWNEVFRIWADLYKDKVVLIDRGGDIDDYGLQRIKLPKFNMDDQQSSIRALTWLLMRKGARSMLSTYYTFCEHLPTNAVVYDMIPETLGFSGPEWDLKHAYLQRSTSGFAISRSTLTALVKHYPHLKNSANYCLPGISPVFKPASEGERTAVRKALNIEKRWLFVLPCVLGGYKDGLTALQAVSLIPFVNDVEVVCTALVADAEAIIKLFPQVNIRFMRFKNDSDYASLISAADLVLWPSRIEGVGFPPIEAIASGTKMVCCRTDVNLEVYGNAAIYAEPGDPVSFASVITQVLAAKQNPRLVEIVSGIRDYHEYAVQLFNFGYFGNPKGDVVKSSSSSNYATP